MSLLSVREAQQRILSHFKPVETEMSSLNTCAGRVLAADIISSDLPPFDNSSVDGFAIIASDVANATSASPLTLSVVADIPAGSSSDITLAHGQAAADHDWRAHSQRRGCHRHGRRYRFQ